MRKPPAKLRGTAASAWKMFKPQIAKLDPICVKFGKQGRLNYNTLLYVSFFFFGFQLCGLIFQQQCKPERIYRPRQCQERRGNKMVPASDWGSTRNLCIQHATDKAADSRFKTELHGSAVPPQKENCPPNGRLKRSGDV